MSAVAASITAGQGAVMVTGVAGHRSTPVPMVAGASGRNGAERVTRGWPNIGDDGGGPVADGR